MNNADSKHVAAGGKDTGFNPSKNADTSSKKTVLSAQSSELITRFEVVEQLKAARKAQDMTQEALAARVGTKKSNISRFESGRYNPSLDFLIKVAGSLGKQLQIKVK